MTDGAGGGGDRAGSARGEALYQELILDHYRHPRNKGVLADADVTLAHHNPLCGDELVVYLALDGPRVREARFTGQGCAISQAAASMLTTAVRGATVTEARALLARYASIFAADATAATAAADPALGDLRSLAGVSRLPARVKCALLPADAFAAALAQLQARPPV
ncbi:MAG: Fe-S cluster assembly sulfur transfer protein SufU [Gemmatimonadaceae bacterium]